MKNPGLHVGILFLFDKFLVEKQHRPVDDSGLYTDSGFTGDPDLAVGTEFDVYLEKLENQDGLVVLSKESSVERGADRGAIFRPAALSSRRRQSPCGTGKTRKPETSGPSRIRRANLPR